MPGLDRFKTAQNSPHAGFASALAEIRAGGKTSHWIWYVFPQIAGLGMSGASQAFAIDGEAEAADYLRDSELRARYLTIATAVAKQLRAGTPPSVAALMGSTIDARKLVSSLTLFGHAARNLYASEGLPDYESIVQIADEVMAIAAAQGYPPCTYTLGRIRRGPS